MFVWKRQCRTMNRGFTLAELMVAAAIFLFVLGGILFSYITCLELAEIAKNSSLATHAAKSKLEEIKNTAFNQIYANYHNVSFTAAGLNGRGVRYVDNSDPDLLHVIIEFCWRQPNGRIIGEDQDLDGLLDGGEDDNGNGRLDSIVILDTYIYKG